MEWSQRSTLTLPAATTHGNSSKEFVIPTAKSQPGFVRGVWLRSNDGASGRGFVLFDTEEHASAAAELARQGPPPKSPATMRSVEVFEVVGEA
jgi:hypothetical protein